MITEQERVRLIFGLKVKSLRQQKGLSFQQLQGLTGLSLSYLHDMETGKKYPKADKILLLAKALEVDYDYLVSLHAGKKLQPIIDLYGSDFVNAIPWEHFGFTPATLLELFANTPDKVTAFISTMITISRSYQLSRERFYNAALRSYQDLHDNYFEELELSVIRFCAEFEIPVERPLAVDFLESILLRLRVTVNRKSLSGFSSLQSVRSYFVESKRILYINKSLSPAQERFLLAREIAFQYLQYKDRPYETVVQENHGFDALLNNFYASYFAVALLLPEADFLVSVKQVVQQAQWNPAAWQHLCELYDVSPEMMMQRMTNILPRHFGLDQLFFLRINGDPALDEYDITKELHLSQLHNPYANAIQEHYCRRWVSIHSLATVSTLQKQKKYKKPVVSAQISQYWNTHNKYLCVSFTKPKSKLSSEMVSVTIGILIDPKMAQLMPFVNDRKIPVQTVHTTCERCGILDCKERAFAPIVVEEAAQLAGMRAAFEELSNK